MKDYSELQISAEGRKRQKNLWTFSVRRHAKKRRIYYRDVRKSLSLVRF